MFASHQIRFFHDYAEAEAIEKEEIQKFLAYDREREAQRLMAIGRQPDPPLPYRVSLAEVQPGRKTRH